MSPTIHSTRRTFRLVLPERHAGIHPPRAILLDDVMLGDGVALMHAPGYSMGNHSLVVDTSEGSACRARTA
jgi:hypothetical protein